MISLLSLLADINGMPLQPSRFLPAHRLRVTLNQRPRRWTLGGTPYSPGFNRWLLRGQRCCRLQAQVVHPAPTRGRRYDCNSPRGVRNQLCVLQTRVHAGGRSAASPTAPVSTGGSHANAQPMLQNRRPSRATPNPSCNNRWLSLVPMRKTPLPAQRGPRLWFSRPGDPGPPGA